MNIIWIDGGLGNQMFQYALALKQQQMGKTVKIDVTKYAEHHWHNDFELDQVFGLECPFADLEEIKKLGYRKANRWTEFLRKTPFAKKTIYNHEAYSFDAQVLDLDGYYIEGYWQSEQYFSDIEETIRKTYVFPELKQDWQKELAQSMRETHSVSVHIRRGDYLNYPNLNGICTLDYYKNAMNYFRDRYQKNVCFYIFTNDFEWAKSHFKDEDCCFVQGNTGKESYRDMQLMSLCEHNVIANSSFSWWGAWLNANKEKTVIAPEKWVNSEEDTTAVVPENWMKMKG